jgi:putative serine protease PepD
MSTATDDHTPAGFAPPPPPRPRRGNAVALAFAGLATVIAVVALVLSAVSDHDHTSTVVTSAPGATSDGGSGLNAAAIFANANPGVVDITAQSKTTTANGPFGLPRQAQSADSGTGMVLDGRGDVLTADHVVAGADSISVTFQGGATRSAKVLGADPATDVAVLKLDATGLTLHPLALGTLSGHRVGDPVAVIGDPFDVQRSLSTGVISGLDRAIQGLNGASIPGAVQTDAAMNPGNSGGPVLDGGGRVIGIADQIDTGGSGVDSSTGVGFAVSIDVVKSELTRLEAGATPAHAYIGVGAADATDSGGDAGAQVQTVQSGGPAARAGLRPGDLIVALGSAKISGVNDLIAAAAARKPGDRTTLTVVRDGSRMVLHITLGTQPQHAAT